jgi:FdhD protein
MKEEAPGIAEGQLIRRQADGALKFEHDDLTVEEPLEIRLGPATVATTMRTPGQDEELAAGFLMAEGVLRSPDEVTGFTRPDSSATNILTVNLKSGVKVKLENASRLGTISSSCGICGKANLTKMLELFLPITFTSGARVKLDTLLHLPARLREQQSDFQRTGGLHAAGIFNFNGEAAIVREDIGRHNATDKVIGRAFLDRMLPLSQHVLMVSGRLSFEIMQKALAAGVPVVASVSAPSTLAVTVARASGQAVVGFLRPPTCNIYAHAEWIQLET